MDPRFVSRCDTVASPVKEWCFVSYLADVKSELKGLFDEAFQHAWEEIVEPALKQSYKNGVADGRAGKGENGEREPKPRRQWGARRSGGAGGGGV